MPNWCVDLFACKSVCNSRPMINANRRKGGIRGERNATLRIRHAEHNIEDDTVWP